MNMDFEQLLKQEVQKAARQDYEEITAKAQDYPYKFSKEFNEKMKGIIREENLSFIFLRTTSISMIPGKQRIPKKHFNSYN